MNHGSFTFTCQFLLILPDFIGAKADSVPVTFKVSPYAPSYGKTTNIFIQTIVVDSIEGVRQDIVGKINSGLSSAVGKFANDAKRCRGYAQGHPWEYELKFEKVILSKKYLSVIFSKFSVCAGSPDIEKEPVVFSRVSGNVESAAALIAEMVPSAEILSTLRVRKNLIRFSEKTAESIVEENKENMKSYDDRCDFFLKNTSYRVWVDAGNLVVFPEFLQPESVCQKEYFLKGASS